MTEIVAPELRTPFGIMTQVEREEMMLMRGIMANMVLCVIPGQGNSKIVNLVKSGSFDSPIFLYIPNDEKTSTGHLI